MSKRLVYRLYREEGLGLRARPKQRRMVCEHTRQKPRATGENEVWSLDFVADQLSDGRRFRALTAVDAYTRECQGIEVGQSLKGHDVVRVLQQVSQQRGTPRIFFCDNGSEFTSQLMDLWAYHNRVEIDFPRPREANRLCLYRKLQRRTVGGAPRCLLVRRPRRGVPPD